MMKKQIVQPEGNYYDKYHSKNPIEKGMLENFFNCMKGLLKGLNDIPQKILEVGCGEGEVTGFIHSLYPSAYMEAFDISENVIGQAAVNYPDISFYAGDIYTMQMHGNNGDTWALSGGYDIVVCSEVLEHLDKPDAALQKLKEMSNKYILVSVPNEPLWRILNMARGKYWSDLGNTPGHIQHWNKRTFCRMLEKNGYKVQKIKSPLPWIMCLAKNV